MITPLHGAKTWQLPRAPATGPGVPRVPGQRVVDTPWSPTLGAAHSNGFSGSPRDLGCRDQLAPWFLVATQLWDALRRPM